MRLFLTVFSFLAFMWTRSFPGLYGSCSTQLALFSQKFLLCAVLVLECKPGWLALNIPWGCPSGNFTLPYHQNVQTSSVSSCSQSNLKLSCEPFLVGSQIHTCFTASLCFLRKTRYTAADSTQLLYLFSVTYIWGFMQIPVTCFVAAVLRGFWVCYPWPSVCFYGQIEKFNNWWAPIFQTQAMINWEIP